PPFGAYGPVGASGCRRSWTTGVTDPAGICRSWAGAGREFQPSSNTSPAVCSNRLMDVSSLDCSGTPATGTLSASAGQPGNLSDKLRIVRNPGKAGAAGRSG